MHDGCVLWGGVGTGKTITALAYSMLRHADRHIVVITTAKKRDSGDWSDEAGLLGIPFDQIEVSSWNKIGDYVDRKDTFFIFDEQRLVGTGAWVKFFYKIAKTNPWILLSATPGDTWSDYAPMFIANGYYKNITEFRNTHAVYSRYSAFPKIERYIGEGRLVKYRDHLLVEMPMERHTTRHMHDVEVDFDKDTLDIVRKKRWNVYDEVPLKNAAELFSVMRKVVSTDPSRKQALRSLIGSHPRLIVFYNYNYELEIMRDLLTEIQETIDQDTESQNSSKFKKKSNGLYLPTESTEVESTNKNLLIGQKSSIDGETLGRQEQDIIESKVCPITPSTEPPWQTNPTPDWTETYDDFGTTIKTRTLTELSGSSTISSKRLAESKLWSPPTVELSNELLAKSLKDSVSSDLPNPLKLSASGGSFGWAEWNGHKHEPIPDTDRWVYLVQYASGSEGWNCITTDAMAFWSLTYSWKQFQQAQGRIDRMNTPFTDLHYYIMMTDSMAEKPVKMSLDKKRDFQPR